MAVKLKNLLNETKVFYFRSRGPGGQRKNKKKTAVKLLHMPTGIKAIATEYRLQSRNKKLAFNRLRKKLIEINKRKKPRVRISVPLAVKEEILRKKKLRSEKKRLRKKVNIQRITNTL